MADRNRYRDDDFDDEDLNPPPSSGDNTGTILATIFGVWAAVIGGIGLIWVIVFLCFLAVFLCVFCIIGTIMYTALSRMPPPAAVNSQPVQTVPNRPPLNPPAEEEKPKPRPINPNWNDAALKRTYLSDLPEFDARVGWGKFGKKGMLGTSAKHGEVNSPITFQGQRDPEALSTGPSPFQAGTVKYRLNKEYKLFKASVACNDLDKNALGSRQPMTFKVFGDGPLLWVSDPVQAVGRKQDVRLGVEGVNELELRVECRDSFNARAIWLDAQVLK